MKTLFTLGACALLSLKLFSCSADDLDNQNKPKTEVKKTFMSEPITDPGPDDDLINVKPPKK